MNILSKKSFLLAILLAFAATLPAAATSLADKLVIASKISADHLDSPVQADGLPVVHAGLKRPIESLPTPALYRSALSPFSPGVHSGRAPPYCS